MDMSRNDPASDHLADEFHHRRKSKAGHFFRHGISLGCSQSCPCMGLRKISRFERGGNCILWILRLLLVSLIPDRASAQRVPLVRHQQTNRLAFVFFNHCGFLWLLPATALSGHLPRNTHGNSQRRLLDSSVVEIRFLGSDSELNTSIAHQAEPCSQGFSECGLKT